MSKPQDAAPHPYRADLQGLRAMAVLLVFLGHAGVPQVPGGFVGVDVFFVLSGYLITALLLREIEWSGRISFLGFYARRMKRLLPAMVLMLGLVFLAGSELLSGAEARAQLASLPYAASWTSNFHYTFTHFDYFDELAARDLYLHTWSLAVEEQFYLLWPVLLLLLARGGSARRTAGGLLLVFLASLTASAAWTAEQAQFGYYMMPSRIWQFALGGLTHLALAHEGLRSRLSRQGGWLAWTAGGLLILGSAMALHPRLAYPGLWALLPSLGAALVIAGGTVLQLRNPLAHPALVWVGDRSYSIYLWHWPVLVLTFSLGFKGNTAVTFSLAMLALLLAMLSYRWVELPFWKGRAGEPRISAPDPAAGLAGHGRGPGCLRPGPAPPAAAGGASPRARCQRPLAGGCSGDLSPALRCLVHPRPGRALRFWTGDGEEDRGAVGGQHWRSMVLHGPGDLCGAGLAPHRADEVLLPDAGRGLLL